jgi:hypothetical protein
MGSFNPKPNEQNMLAPSMRTALLGFVALLGLTGLCLTTQESHSQESHSQESHSQESSESHESSEFSGNAMVIVEPRQHELLSYVLENFDRNVDASYDLYIFHGKSAGNFARDAARGVKRRRVVLRALDVDNFTANEYNALLKSPAFYNSIDAENILVFQTDAVSCGSSSKKLREFEKYGYIGCPYRGNVLGLVPDGHWWGNGHSFYGVGGLSFRKKSVALRCIARESTTPDFAEDVFFGNCLDKGHGVKPETVEVLRSWCMQDPHDQRAFGVHKPNVKTASEKAKLLAYCPEAAPLVSQTK